MPRSTLAARNCAAVIIGLPPGTLTKHHSCMITNDVKVSISDIWYIYSKGFRPRRRRTEHRAETITARGDAFGAADIDARECCWQLWFDRQLPFEFALPASYMRCCSPKHFSGPHMIPKTILTAAICAVLLAGASPSKANEYRPDEFLSLDLSKAVLSPKPLGPSSEFAPVAIEARTDPGSDGAGARVEPRANPKIAVSRSLKVTVPKAAVAVPNVTVAHIRPAEARDTRIQVWPCQSGGICNWQRQND